MSRKPSPPDKSMPSNTVTNSEDWTTGDETVTATYLRTLCEEAEVEIGPSLTKAEALKDELRATTGQCLDP
jgi:hypothetical protein